MELLERHARHCDEDAFAAIVQRHLGLVYSAALRQVRSPELAEEVSQSVFVDLARNAVRLRRDTILTAWLYQVTRRTAIDVIRREVSRQLREQVASEMNAMNANTDWTQIEPLLDEAMLELEETDRKAVLLRYFENKSLKEVGSMLGTTDEAARKRVNRAVDCLREVLAKRGVTVGASVLTAIISANAVHAAPVGLSVTISTAALGGGTLAATTVATITQSIAMTTLQKTFVAAALLAAVGTATYEARQAANQSAQNRELEQRQTSLLGQIQQLQLERDASTQRVASLTKELANVQKAPSEVMKLRGQVGVLRQEKDDLGKASALSKITADPATRKAMRDQQKMGMQLIYGDLMGRMKLSSEVGEKFHDLLADDVMDQIDLITQSLQDKAGTAEVDRVFSAHEAALRDKLGALIGPSGLEQYDEYSKDILGTLTAAQFESSLTGEKDAKTEKKQQLLQAMREENHAALAAAGLSANFQTVPMLNLRNIASEESAEKNLSLMDGVYERVEARAASFLSADELTAFQGFRKKALENSRSALLMNRKMMAPIVQ